MCSSSFTPARHTCHARPTLPAAPESRSCAGRREPPKREAPEAQPPPRNPDSGLRSGPPALIKESRGARKQSSPPGAVYIPSGPALIKPAFYDAEAKGRGTKGRRSRPGLGREDARTSGLSRSANTLLRWRIAGGGGFRPGGIRYPGWTRDGGARANTRELVPAAVYGR